MAQVIKYSVSLVFEMIFQLIKSHLYIHKTLNSGKILRTKQIIRFTIQGINFQYKIIYFHKNTGL